MTDIHSILPKDLQSVDEIGDVIQAALDAADPFEAVKRALLRKDDVLIAGFRTYRLDNYKHIFLLGAGKASFAMSLAAADLLSERELHGAVVVKYMPEDTEALERRGIRVMEGDHPVPGDRSLKASQEIIKFTRRAGKKDLVVFTLSGGASALFTSPRSGICLSDLQKMTDLMLASGAEIGEINTLRKHLDEVKGGGLARMTWPADLLVLSLSDVIGSPPEVIGSGPASADHSTFQDARTILEKYHIIEKTPISILAELQKGLEGQSYETLRTGDPIIDQVNYVLVGSNEQSVKAARMAAVNLGFESDILSTSIKGEAREVGRMLAIELAGRIRPGGNPFCLLAGGETTVTIKGDGLGGRNLELALGAVETLSTVPGVVLVTLASDGDDGPSGAAGAVVTGETLRKASSLGLNPRDYLENNNSCGFFEKAGGLLITGPTGTNVNDLVFLFGNLSS